MIDTTPNPIERASQWLLEQLEGLAWGELTVHFVIHGHEIVRIQLARTESVVTE